MILFVGSCIDELAGFRCVCDLGYTGVTCSDESLECEHRPCQHGGTCVDLVNAYECRCVAGWTGNLCQDNIDDCVTVPCANGGICHDLVNDFECDCPTGFGGKTCGVDLNECLSLPCQNGGTCSDQRSGYSCACADGYHGVNCHLQHGQTDSITTPSTQRVTSSTEHVVNTVAAELTSPQSESPSPAAPRNDKVIVEDKSMLSMQIALIICLGVGLPLIIIIIVLFVLLWRKRRHRPRDDDTAAAQRNASSGDADRQNSLNVEIANSMNNKQLNADVHSSAHVVTSQQHTSSVNIQRNNLLKKNNNTANKLYTKADVNASVRGNDVNARSLQRHCLDARDLQRSPQANYCR